MTRTALWTGVALVVVISLVRADEDVSLQNTLALQQAMGRAKDSLRQGDSKKAVDALEAQLAHVNGNTAFLSLLKEAYRTYIKDLWLLNRPTEAQRYLDRLCIIDAAAANDPTLRPPQPGQLKLPSPPDAKGASSPSAFGSSVFGLKKKASFFLPDFSRLNPFAKNT